MVKNGRGDVIPCKTNKRKRDFTNTVPNQGRRPSLLEATIRTVYLDRESPASDGSTPSGKRPPQAPPRLTVTAIVILVTAVSGM